MALGQNYLGSAYLGQGYKTSVFQGIFTATFTASLSAPTVIVPTAGTFTATFSAAGTPTLFASTSGSMTATFSAVMTSSALTVHFPTTQPGVAHGPGKGTVPNNDPSSIDFSGDPTTDPGHLHTSLSTSLEGGVGTVKQWGGSGAPPTSLGGVGDYYFRSDTPSTANQRIYIKTASATWTGIV